MAKVVKRMTSDFNQAESIGLLFEVLLKDPNLPTPIYATIQQLQSVFSGGGSADGGVLESIAAMDAADHGKFYGVQLPEVHPELGIDHFNLTCLRVGSGDGRIQIAYGYSSTGNMQWIRSGETNSYGEFNAQASQDWVSKNFAEASSGITPPLSETVQFTIGANTYTITDESAENITVQAIVTGSIDYGVLTADKAVKIINAGPAAITIDGTSVAAGVTAFAIFDLATGDWTISTVIDPIVPNYSDIAVAQYTTTGVVLSPIGYFKIAAHGMGGTTAGNLIFVNNVAQQSAIGVYQALEGAGSGEIKAKKIATGVKLNVVRVASGAVYVSQYDGLNITSLKFSEMSTKEYAESLVVNIWKDKGNWNPSENANQYPIATGIKKGWLWVISGLGTGISAAMGTVTVQDGDTVRALVDNPGQTDTNWTTLENNLGYTPENSNNKTDDVESHKTSSVKFASVKGNVDWITARFAKLVPTATQTFTVGDYKIVVKSGPTHTTGEYIFEVQNNAGSTLFGINTQGNAYFRGSAQSDSIGSIGRWLIDANEGYTSGSLSGLKWGNAASAGSTKDTAIMRNSAGVVEINNGTPGQLRDAIMRGLKVGTVYQTQLTVATNNTSITTISVGHTTNFPETGTILIGTTSINYTSKTSTSISFSAQVVPTYAIGTTVLVTSSRSYTEILADGSIIESMNVLTAGTVETTYPLMRGKETNILNNLPTGVNSIFTIPTPEAGFKNESVVHFSVGSSLPTLVYSGFTPKWLNNRALSTVANKSYTIVFEQVRTASGTWIVKASYGEY